MTHTPGPWRCEPLRYRGGEHIEPPYIRGRYDIFPIPDDNEAEANARLIAAAPELLEALKALTDKAESVLGDHKMVIIDARAAIDAATKED